MAFLLLRCCVGFIRPPPGPQSLGPRWFAVFFSTWHMVAWSLDPWSERLSLSLSLPSSWSPVPFAAIRFVDSCSSWDLYHGCTWEFGGSTNAPTYTTGPNTPKLRFLASLSTLNHIQNALFLNPKHNILTPRVLEGRIPTTNSSEMERRKVPQRVGFKAECPPEQHPVKEWDTPTDERKKIGVGHRDGKFVHNHSVSTLLHLKKKKKKKQPDGHHLEFRFIPYMSKGI